MSWADDLAAAYRDYGLDVRPQGAWLDRAVTNSNGVKRSWTHGKPVGRINHHFVIPYGRPDMNAVDMLINGYSAGPKPPVVNEYLGQTGIVYLIAAGPTSHPGMGSRGVLDRVTSDRPPLGDAAMHGYPNDLPQSEAEGLYWGTECHHPGTAVSMPDAQYAALVKLNAAFQQVFGYSAARCIQHREHTNRKNDIHPFAVNAFNLRAQSAALVGAPEWSVLGFLLTEV